MPTETQLTAFGRQVDRHLREASRVPLDPEDYAQLWQWSVDNVEWFWAEVWEFFQVGQGQRYDRVLSGTMPRARWFEGASVNYAAAALGPGDDADLAVVTVSEDGRSTTLSRAELRQQVASAAAWLRSQGVRPGDRVVGYLPAGHHAVVALLASAAVGAIWSVCSQDLGAAGAIDRFAQLEPTVLFAADGYRFKGREHDRRSAVRELRAGLPSLRNVVFVDHLGLAPIENAEPWGTVVAGEAGLVTEPVDFSHPLWVLFTSGTTGRPKGLVHSHGGVVVEHLKVHGLHHDLGPDDTLFCYTTTTWMVWNAVVSGLLLGSTVLFYEGSPAYPGPERLWELCSEYGVTVLGTSPAYLLACEQAGVRPMADRNLSRLRTVLCTGAPVPVSAHAWLADQVPGAELVPECGGTDVVSAFATSAVTSPSRPGEMSARALGVALEAWDDEGRPLVDRVGELVVTRPMPSMPLYFWDDPDGQRYHDAYFSTYPGVWRHGDWATVTGVGGVIVAGRSDSTLNRRGVRIGSADIYAVVEQLPEVLEALVVGVEHSETDYWMPLFLVLAPGAVMDESLEARVRQAIAVEVSARHVPDEVISVAAIPHTRTGKKMEVPVKRILMGWNIRDVVSPETVDDFAALESFRRYALPRAVVHR